MNSVQPQEPSGGWPEFQGALGAEEVVVELWAALAKSKPNVIFEKIVPDTVDFENFKQAAANRMDWGPEIRVRFYIMGADADNDVADTATLRKLAKEAHATPSKKLKLGMSGRK